MQRRYELATILRSVGGSILGNNNRAGQSPRPFRNETLHKGNEKFPPARYSSAKRPKHKARGEGGTLHVVYPTARYPEATEHRILPFSIVAGMELLRAESSVPGAAYERNKSGTRLLFSLTSGQSNEIETFPTRGFYSTRARDD